MAPSDSPNAASPSVQTSVRLRTRELVRDLAMTSGADPQDIFDEAVTEYLTARGLDAEQVAASAQEIRERLLCARCSHSPVVHGDPDAWIGSGKQPCQVAGWRCPERVARTAAPTA